MESCILCGESLLDAGNPTNVVTRGIPALLNASKERGDNVQHVLEGKTSIIVHVKCRKMYTRPSSIAAATAVQRCQSSDSSFSDAEEGPNRLSRSSIGSAFDIKVHCLFCGKDAMNRASTKLPQKYRKVVHEVRTLPLFNSIKKHAIERKDEWGQLVLSRIAGVGDLVAAQAKYCRDCYSSFFRKPSEKGVGRPEDVATRDAFLKLCCYIENNDESQFSVTELLEKLTEFLPGKEIYSSKYLLRKLSEHFGEKITFSTSVGRGNVTVVTLSDTSHKLLRELWNADRMTDLETKRKKIVEEAAQIIREDIRKLVYDSSAYPSTDCLSIEEASKLIPKTLRRFFDIVLQSKAENVETIELKKASLAHAIISVCRPRSFVSPILTALGLHVHRQHGSRQLIETLNNLAFCCSYKEVQRYEYSLIEEQSVLERKEKGFIQYVFDNADFNVRTIDGHGTFHAMGGIKCTTPHVSQVNSDVPRIMEVPSAGDIAAKGHFPISWYKKPLKPGLKKVVIEALSRPTPERVTMSPHEKLDLLWLVSVIDPMSIPRPHWNGFMRTVYAHFEARERSTIEPVPFINLDPGNLSTINTALTFAADQCKKNGQNVCFVTFDQPLYAKAVEIVATYEPESDLAKIIVRLGGFHMLMSFMGSIGYIMQGSGLEDVWSELYAKASITHMLTGHAFSRALRAHFITQTALGIVILADTPEFEDTLKNELMSLIENLQSATVSSLDVIESPSLKKLEGMFLTAQNTLRLQRTPALWLQYYHQVSLIRLFLRAERTGDWSLHLECVQNMLPFFHSAGHLSYAKYGQFYLQQMINLHALIPEEEFLKYTKEGYFTIRRSEKFWSGISTDLIIEQDLMRTLKATGGLTRGRGLTESSLAKFVLAHPSSWKVITAFETMCGIAPGTSEQHVELRDSRVSRDNKDLGKILKWFEEHPPFVDRSSQLTSIASGVVADNTVNCDEAEHHGLKAMQEIVGNNFCDVTMKRKNRVKPLSVVNGTIKIRGEEIPVNPHQLFMRITCILKCPEDFKEYLSYELAPKPPSLFDGPYMRKTTKSALAETIEKNAPCTDNLLTDQVNYVVDGGFLLRKVVWPRPATYRDICRSYVQYVLTHYGESTVVVFDGYDSSMSTKVCEQSRRSRCVAADAVFDLNMVATSKQEQFLSNSRNKTRLIASLMQLMRDNGLQVNQADSDADTLIVTTAIEAATLGQEVAVVGTDTDLLSLMIARAESSSKMFFMKPSPKETKVFSIQDIQNKIGDIKENLLFLHAASGCDTTSSLFRKGKKTVWKLLNESAALRHEVNIFNDPSATKSQVISAGEKFLLAVYGGGKFSSLNEFRYIALHNTVARQKVSAEFDLSVLPPTSDAASLHSQRVYLQVQHWLGNSLTPTEWGWRVSDGQLTPTPSTLPPAPDKLLHLITCNCKGQCERNCDCARAGLPCSAMCSRCIGDCANGLPTSLQDDEDVDDAGL